MSPRSKKKKRRRRTVKRAGQMAGQLTALALAEDLGPVLSTHTAANYRSTNILVSLVPETHMTNIHTCTHTHKIKINQPLKKKQQARW